MVHNHFHHGKRHTTVNRFDRFTFFFLELPIPHFFLFCLRINRSDSEKQVVHKHKTDVWHNSPLVKRLIGTCEYE